MGVFVPKNCVGLDGNVIAAGSHQSPQKAVDENDDDTIETGEEILPDFVVHFGYLRKSSMYLVNLATSHATYGLQLEARSDNARAHRQEYNGHVLAQMLLEVVEESERGTFHHPELPERSILTPKFPHGV